MKIFGQNIPPALAAAYAALVSPTDAGLPSQTKIRTHKQTKKTKTAAPLRKKTRAEIYTPTAIAIATMQGLRPGDEDYQPFITARRKELLSNTLNPDYWQPCQRTDDIMAISYPSSSPDPSPPPYAYPDPENLPTIPAYPPGEEADDASTYSGHTEAGFFQDDSWSWFDRVYRLTLTADAPDITPLAISVVAELIAASDMRGSRPMLSMLLKIDWYTTQPDIYEDLTPPANPSYSAYYKFRLPPADAPYYTMTADRILTWVPVDRAAIAGATHCRVRLACRPMFGRGYNNNTQVDIAMTAEFDLYQGARKTIPWGSPAFAPTSDEVITWTDQLDAETTTPAHPGTTPIMALRAAYLSPHPTDTYTAYQSDDPLGIFLGFGDYGKLIGQSARGLLYFGTDTPLPYGTGQNHTIAELDSPSRVILIYQARIPDSEAEVPISIGALWGDFFLDHSGTAMNSALGWRHVPTITINPGRLCTWDHFAYIQDDKNQWWEYESPAIATYGPWWLSVEDYPDYLGEPTYHEWSPRRKFGPRIQTHADFFPTPLGLIWPSPYPVPHDHYLLTWAGALTLTTVPEYDYATYIGTMRGT